jgi:hypothetical protein
MTLISFPFCHQYSLPLTSEMHSAPAADSNKCKLVQIGSRYCHLVWWILSMVCISLSASVFASATSCVKSASLQIYNLPLQLLDDLEPPIQFPFQPVAVAWRH